MRVVAVLFRALICHGLSGCTGQPSVPADELGSPSAAGRARPAITLRVADIINLDVRDVPLLMAFDQLAAQGYVIEKIYLTSSTLTTSLLASGDAEVAIINNQTAWTAISKGADIRTVGLFTNPSNVLAAHGDLRSCGDLHGRRVGAAGTGGFTSLQLTLYIERHCPGTQPQVLVMPEARARAAALLARRIDATLLPVEELLRLQRQSSTPLHALMSQATEFRDVKVDGLHVHRAWAEAHPDAVRGLLRAQLEAHRLVAENPRRLYDESVKRLSLDTDTAEAIGGLHLQNGIWDPDGGLTMRDVESTIDFLVKADALPGGLAARQVADLSYLEAVLDEIGRAPSR